MEVGWIIIIAIFGTLAVVGKCGELYYNSHRSLHLYSKQEQQKQITNLLSYKV